eukprot:gb/GECH01014053.1/.p1 GENE.gb/GECH01014053.1/~~gb/GECH01014053.1/.p1  ORF type:complete len:179 (+),score=61.32 gb/GECH01014053.1/:1-537(+)
MSSSDSNPNQTNEKSQYQNQQHSFANIFFHDETTLQNSNAKQWLRELTGIVFECAHCGYVTLDRSVSNAVCPRHCCRYCPQCRARHRLHKELFFRCQRCGETGPYKGASGHICMASTSPPSNRNDQNQYHETRHRNRHHYHHHFFRDVESEQREIDDLEEEDRALGINEDDYIHNHFK